MRNVLYIDENLPHQLVATLSSIQNVLNHKEKRETIVKSVKLEFGAGAKDEDWIPKVAGCYVLTADYRIQTTRHQNSLYQQHGVGMFFIKTPSKNGMSFWEYVKLIIKRWDQMKKLMKKEELPFAYRCSSRKEFEPLD